MKLLLWIKVYIKSTFLQNVTQSLSSASSRAVYRPKVVHPIRYKRTTCKNVVEEIYSPNWTAMKRSCTQVAHGQRHAPSSWLPLIAGSAMSCSYNSLHQGHRPNVNAIPMRMLVCNPNYSPGNAMMVMDFFSLACLDPATNAREQSTDCRLSWEVSSAVRSTHIPP